jgi:hypothetical protein
MKMLIDMNLPPRWVDFLAGHGISATHWSGEGDMKAPDSEVLMWARERNHVVFTHDLDFGVLLSMTQEAAVEKHREALDRGAILSIQQQTARVRVLPIRKAGPEEPPSGR